MIRSVCSFETEDNYSIRFKISNNTSTIRFNSIRNEKNTIRTALYTTLHANLSQSYGASPVIWDQTATPDTGEYAPSKDRQTDWYSIYLLSMDRRLS